MRFLLIDGLSVFYRAYYSGKVEYNSHGEPINALRRYLHIIDKFNIDYPSDEIIICEDAPYDTLYRQKLYQGYKKGRKKHPDELYKQKNILFGFLRKIGFPVVGISGYEADDIIGTLSQTLSDEGHNVLISSSDKDIYQLLTNDKIALVQHNPMTKTQMLLYRDDVYAKMGYWPEQVVDMKILSGDASDNIPGIPKYGTKNAVSFLQKYHSIKKILESDVTDPEDIETKNYLIQNKDMIDIFREVITIQREIDPDLISKQLAYRVSEKTFDDTLARYQVITPDDFSTLSYAGYLYNRLEDVKEDEL